MVAYGHGRGSDYESYSEPEEDPVAYALRVKTQRLWDGRNLPKGWPTVGYADPSRGARPHR